MALGDGPPFPRPDRFLLSMWPVPEGADANVYPVIDMTAAGAFSIHGTSGVNAFGREVVLDVTQHLTADFPGSDSPGIEYHFVFKMVDREDYNWTWYYQTDFGITTGREIPYDAWDVSPSTGVLIVADDPTFMDIDWPPIGPVIHLWWQPVGQCYLFDEVGSPLLSAEFNGVDAYIALDHLLPSVNAPFIWEAQIKFNDITENPFFGVASSGGFIGFRDDNDFTIGNIRPDPTWDANLDQWYLIRLQFEQTGQLKYELFVDDVDVWTAVSNRQNFAINRLGVYKQGVGGSLWADLSMRHLKWWVGSVPSTDLVLDMPLTENALDLSVEENHGTPFNMDLPAT